VQILKEDGIGGLYRGLKANLLRTIPAAAVTFVTYEESRKLLIEWADKSEKDTECTVAAADSE
jgi:Mitochondrial carrier protein